MTMSCGPDIAKFRLLDAYVGWSESPVRPPENLVGLGEPEGIRLAPKHDGISPADVWLHFLPPRLARGCGSCDWYLITPVPSRLLKRGACAPVWTPIWTSACDPRIFVAPVALAAWQHRIAVADPGAGKIWLWEREGDRLLAEIHLPGVTVVGFAPSGEVLATMADSRDLLRFSPDGRALPRWAELPADGRAVEAIAPSKNQCEVLLVTKSEAGVRQLWRASRGKDRFTEITADDLQKYGLEFSGVNQATDRGFCIEETSPNGLPSQSCYDWYGRPVTAEEVGALPSPELEEAGKLLTEALDSGIPRCRWHRVQIDADVPPGTSLSVQVASSEDRETWPAAEDWSPLDTTNDLDFLIDQPPGRYLFARVALHGNGTSTPVVRRIRLDFPRATSLDFLPPVYREDPRAEDFTERFVSLFDAPMADIDRAIERFPALLDVDGVPEDVLPWLGSFLDLVFDAAWETSRRRTILRALPRLYRLRGTVEGIKLAIRLVFDTDVAIQETGLDRAWGAITHRHINKATCSRTSIAENPFIPGRDAVLGQVRLFGRSRTRLTLGRSPLSRAPLKSYGNPDHDPSATGAYRFRVLVPRGALGRGADRQRLDLLIENQKPAHTQATVRIADSGFVIGAFSSIGVDSALGPLPAPILGHTGNVRLRRMTVLWPARRGRRPSIVLGGGVIAGIQTIME